MELKVTHTRDDHRTRFRKNYVGSEFTITHRVTFTSEERGILSEYQLGKYLVSLAGLSGGAAEPPLARLLAILEAGVPKSTTDPVETVRYVRSVNEACQMLRSIISLFESSERTVSTSFPRK